MLKEVQGTEATCRRGSIVPKDGAESSKGTRREEEALMRQQIISWKMGSVERHCEDKSPFDRCSRCRHLNSKASSARNEEIRVKRGRLSQSGSYTTARGRRIPRVRPSEPRSKVNSTAQRKAGRLRWGLFIGAGVLAVSVWCHLQQGNGRGTGLAGVRIGEAAVPGPLEGSRSRVSPITSGNEDRSWEAWEGKIRGSRRRAGSDTPTDSNATWVHEEGCGGPESLVNRSKKPKKRECFRVSSANRTDKGPLAALHEGCRE